MFIFKCKSWIEQYKTVNVKSPIEITYHMYCHRRFMNYKACLKLFISNMIISDIAIFGVTSFEEVSPFPNPRGGWGVVVEEQNSTDTEEG